MPQRPSTPCKHNRCPKLVSYGNKYCEEHKPLVQFDTRSTKEKGYTSRWRTARSRFLKVNPFCLHCQKQGKLVKATVVDHITPHRGDQDLFWDQSNWQPLCKSCHDRKTQTEDRFQEFRYRF